MKSTGILRQAISVAALSCLLSGCALGAGTAETKNTAGTAPQQGTSTVETPATDPEYRLSKGDEIAISVFNQTDFSTAQRIDNRGIIRIPHIGELVIANRTVREAEKFLETTFVERKLLRSPMVSIGVREYSLREISVLGAMNNAGKYRLPREASSVDIVEVVTNMGGLKPTAKGNDVKVTRVNDNGVEEVLTVDVEAMIKPRRGDNSPRSFLVYPGDRIYVPERLF